MHKGQILQLQCLPRANQDEWQGLLHTDVLRQNQSFALPIIHKVLYAWQIRQEPSFRRKPQVLVSLVRSACNLITTEIEHTV